MKKIIALLFVFLGIWLVFDRLTGKAAPLVLPTPTPSPVANPKTIRIPKLEVETTVESVGLAPDGRMGVPSSADTVGWWNRGVRPGEKGSVVIAGHFDNPRGEPGVFAELVRLSKGDEIFMTDENEREYRYLVTEQATFADAAFPLTRVFADDTGYILNLVTCSGTYDRQAQNYDKRLVVFSQLADNQDLRVQ